MPGRGLYSTVALGTKQFEIIVGNELLLSEKGTLHVNDEEQEFRRARIIEWAQEGKSVVLVALRPLSLDANSDATGSNPYRVFAVFAIIDPPRPEAAYIVSELESMGKAVFMCTGDNRITALAVARSVGIDAENVFAGVLPVGKRDVIEKLQRGGATDALQRVWDRKGSKWYRFWGRRKIGHRVKVMFVGDGVRRSSFSFFLIIHRLT